MTKAKTKAKKLGGAPKGVANGNYTETKEIARRLAALEESKSPENPKGSVVRAAEILGGITPNALSCWFRRHGLKVGRHGKYSKEQCIKLLKDFVEKLGHLPTRAEMEMMELKDYWRTHWNNLVDFFEAAEVSGKVDRERMLRLLKGAPTLESLALRTGLTRGKALDYVDKLKNEGLNILFRGDRVSLEATPLQLPYDENLHLFTSDNHGKYRFGIVSDNHLGSKYAREDVLHDLYDWFLDQKVTRVYNAGNWIDGEARFNRHDLLIHGQDEQLKYFAERYPQRENIVTYFVAGDDHEGWYAKDKGVDIGKAAQNMAELMGRRDLKYIGYMEAYIRLRHAVTGCESQMMVVHPGGGSSYAISYAPQKYVEALQGGEKPAVVIFGHWHKMDVFNYRNVWIIQAGTTEDQTPFMRKLKLEAHVGGYIVELQQDAKGSVPMCTFQMKRYFDRGYYNDQFNMAHDINRNVRVPS